MASEFPVPKTSKLTIKYAPSDPVRGYIDPTVIRDIELLAAQDNRAVDYDFDFRIALVNKIVNHGFASKFLPLEEFIEGIYKRNNFRAKQSELAEDLLNKGEFLVRVVHLPDSIGLEIVNPMYLRHIEINPLTNEISSLTLQYWTLLPGFDHEVIFRKTWTPTHILLWSYEMEEDDLEVTDVFPNPLGLVPFAYTKWGTKKRGFPIWQPVGNLIQRFNNTMNEIDDILARNSEPDRVFMSDSEPKGIKLGAGEAIWMGREDKIEYLMWEGELAGYWNYVEELLNDISMISEIPLYRKPSISPDASGEALKERMKLFDAKVNLVRKTFAFGMEYLNKVIFAMAALKMPELFNFRLPGENPKPLSDVYQTLLMRGLEYRDDTALDMVSPVPAFEINLASIIVLPIEFPPLRQVAGEELARYAEALDKLLEREVMSKDEARNLLRGLGVFEEFD